MTDLDRLEIWKAFFTCTEYACEKTGWNNRAILEQEGKE